jgi:hypothetical protein
MSLSVKDLQRDVPNTAITKTKATPHIAITHCVVFVFGLQMKMKEISLAGFDVFNEMRRKLHKNEL